MNATVIDIPGINVNVGVVSSEHSPDQAHTIEIKDSKGNVVRISVAYGIITSINH